MQNSRFSIGFALLFGSEALLAGYFAWQREGALFSSTAAWGLWGLTLSLSHLLARRNVPRVLFLLSGLVLSACAALSIWWLPQGTQAAANAEAQRMAAVLLLVHAFAIGFFGRYVTAVQARVEDAVLSGPQKLARVCGVMEFLAAASLFLGLYSGRDLSGFVATACSVALLGVLTDAALRGLFSLYQPATFSSGSGWQGDSLLLDAVIRRENPLRVLARNFESAYGMRLSEVWALRYLGRLALPMLASVALLVWLWTCFTVVPTGHHGVRLRHGQILAPALQPGLHLSLPWPADRVEVVPTGRVSELSLGFDQDIGGPILWNEKHFEGEKNLLVGSGADLLTINVPIYYRISDPVAYVRRLPDGREALLNMAYRQLLRATIAHDSFNLMTLERNEISERIRAGLQEEIERLDLGIRIVFVGLKDVHPPVEVAPAFQEVVSAEEEKEALIYGGRQYQAEVLPGAQMEANRLRSDTDAVAQERALVAQGEADRFAQVADGSESAPELFRTRRRLEAIEEALALPQKIVLDRDASASGFFLDVRTDATDEPLDGAASALGLTDNSSLVPRKRPGSTDALAQRRVRIVPGPDESNLPEPDFSESAPSLSAADTK